MKNEEINIKPIISFTKRYESAIASKSKEIRLSIDEAGLLNAAIVNLLSSNINEILSNISNGTNNQSETLGDDIIEVKMDAGSFKK